MSTENKEDLCDTLTAISVVAKQMAKKIKADQEAGMYKTYGLVGRIINVRKKIMGATKEDPWAYGEQKMRIEAEYPEYLVATVLPHRNPDGNGISRPYRTVLHKHDIQTGEILLNGGAIR